MRLKEFKDIIVNSNPYEWVYDDTNNQYIYVEDIRISIRKDNPDFFIDDFNLFHEEWAINLPESKAYTCVFNLCFNGQIIEDFVTVSVDGLRCYIPMPNYETRKITKEQYNIGVILNDPKSDTLDSYLDRIGIEKED